MIIWYRILRVYLTLPHKIPTRIHTHGKIFVCMEEQENSTQLDLDSGPIFCTQNVLKIVNHAQKKKTEKGTDQSPHFKAQRKSRCRIPIGLVPGWPITYFFPSPALFKFEGTWLKINDVEWLEILHAKFIRTLS